MAGRAFGLSHYAGKRPDVGISRAVRRTRRSLDILTPWNKKPIKVSSTQPGRRDRLESGRREGVRWGDGGWQLCKSQKCYSAGKGKTPIAEPLRARPSIRDPIHSHLMDPSMQGSKAEGRPRSVRPRHGARLHH